MNSGWCSRPWLPRLGLPTDEVFIYGSSLCPCHTTHVHATSTTDVDLAGLSLYAPGEEGRVVETGAFSDALGSFNRLVSKATSPSVGNARSSSLPSSPMHSGSDEFQFPHSCPRPPQYGKDHPIVISETSAHYTYAIPDSLQSIYCNDCDIRGSLPDVSTLQTVPRDAADEAEIKIGWLDQLVGDRSAGRFPNLTAICFFNYFKFGSAQGNDTGSLVDFRVVGGHDETESRFRQIVGNVTAYQGGYSGHAHPSIVLHSSFFQLVLTCSILLGSSGLLVGISYL